VGAGLRWAEPVVDLRRGEVRCVLEEFTGQGAGDVRRLHAAVPLDGSAAADRSAVRELAPPHHRFVSQALVSPDRRHAVRLAWDHPHMPWDAAELRIAEGPDRRGHGGGRPGAIRGHGAGGFTAALSAAAGDLYACATLFCPVTDLVSLAAGDTHDFESHYLETLIGPAHRTDLYRARSPIRHADRIGVPLLILQGTQDVVCPPAQAFVRRCRRTRGGMSTAPSRARGTAFAGSRR
jgi:pimeloyl-ACP methyl ester carboxylesterase